jgi:hypothetical protein
MKRKYNFEKLEERFVNSELKGKIIKVENKNNYNKSLLKKITYKGYQCALSSSVLGDVFKYIEKNNNDEKIIAIKKCQNCGPTQGYISLIGNSYIIWQK